jgi:hypothetical protein
LIETRTPNTIETTELILVLISEGPHKIGINRQYRPLMDDKQETRTGDQEREEMQAERVSPVQGGEVGQSSTAAEMDIVGGPLGTNDTKFVIETQAAVPASSVVAISNETSGPSSSSTTTAQAIPQDLELIMNMVTNGNDLAALSVADRSVQGQPETQVEVEVEAGSGSEDGA